MLRGEGAEHLGRVLRAEPRQLYELSDGREVWLARIERVAIAKRGESRVEFELIEPLEAGTEELRISLLLSLVKFDRFEWCLEKATELGATEIVPLAAARTDKSLIAAAAKRSARWEKILVESSQQARRLRPPVLGKFAKAGEAFQGSEAELRLILSERAEAPLLNLALKGARPVSTALAIGPEGGWTDEEFAAASSAGFVEASLGGTILRTETAVLATLAILRFGAKA